MNFWNAILKLDRRWIFLVVAIVTAIPIIHPLGLPVFTTKETKGVFDAIEALQPGDPILVAFDYEPGSMPECEPMALALLEHAFRKKLRVTGVTILPVGVGTGEDALAKAAKRAGAVRGVDYTFLGFKAEQFASVITMTVSVQNTFQTDRYGNDTSKLPALEGVKKLEDFKYMAVIHDDSTLETWVVYGQGATGIPMGSLCTAVMASGYIPFIQSGQLTGIVGGLKGASEYESLIGERAMASMGMDSQAVIHMFLIALMALGNTAYLLTRKRGGDSTSSQGAGA